MTLFVTKGDAPLTPVQLEKRAQKYIKRSWSDQAREKSIRLADGAFGTFMATFPADHDVNVTNNTFNWQLQEYRKATARLAQYIVADGRTEVIESQPTGDQVLDEDTGEMVDVMTNVITVTAIDPVEATVTRTVYSDDIDAEPSEETIENPLITTDVAERADAQAVVDGTPQPVKDAE
jgi:hypothetical protein